MEAHPPRELTSPESHGGCPPASERAPSKAERALALGRVLWDFLRIEEVLQPGDAILVFGSADLRSAVWGARLLLDGFAPLLVIAGGRGSLTRDWPLTEAETFAEEAARLGIPRDRMILETRSTNTGENVRFTRRLLAERGLDPRRWILVHAPYVERRARATFEHYWPGKEALVASAPVTLEDYAGGGAATERLLSRLAGEVHRLLEYPGRGWQSPDQVPERIVEAWRELLSLGYDGHLVR